MASLLDRARERREKKRREREELERQRQAQGTLEESLPTGERISQGPIQPLEPVEERRILTPDERGRIAATAPEGYAVDKYGNLFDSRSPEAIAQAKEDIGRFEAGGPTELSESRRVEVAQEQQQLAGQVGQFQQLPVSPEGLDFGEAATTGLTDAIPRALTIAGGAAVAGASVGSIAGTAGAPATAGLSIPAGAAIGASVGFVGSLSASILSDFKEQRRNMNEDPAVILQDGKTALGKWATMAASDPANSGFYINNFNNQLALIDQAHRQVKLDTSRDVLLFERSADLLADFETFYLPGEERDQVIAEMKLALGVQQDADYTYRLAVLAKEVGDKS